MIRRVAVWGRCSRRFRESLALVAKFGKQVLHVDRQRSCLELRSMRKHDSDRATFVGRRFRPNHSAETFDDSLRHGQPDAGARIFGDPVQLLKWLENLRYILHLESDTVVSDDDRVSVLSYPKSN